MRIKSETFDKFQKFVCEVECKSGKILKHWQTDLEWKFANEAFEENIPKESVQWKPSAFYTLQQNKKVEQFNSLLFYQFNQLEH